MGIGNISWGAVLVGAAVAVAVVALSPHITALSAIASFAAEHAASSAYVYAGAAVVGGIVAEFVSDLLGRTGQAVTTIAGR